MSKKTKEEKESIKGSSNWKPSWLNSLTDKKMKSISDIFLFFVIETPIVNESYRSIDFKDYGWDVDNMWNENSMFLNGINDILFDDQKKKFSMKYSCNDIYDYLEKNNINEDKINENKRELFLFLKYDTWKGVQEKYMSFFKHIRNSFAHGRFAISDNYLILEDVSTKNKVDEKDKVVINALIVIKIEKLRRIISFIKKMK